MKHLLLFFSLLFLALFARASNHTSGSVTYSHVQGTRYKVIYKLIRDCRAMPFSINNGFYVYNGNLKATFTPVRTSIREISFNTKPACGSGNTTAGEGWEEHTYEAVVDVDTIGASKFKPVCRVWFAFDRCCKNGAVTNLYPGNYYIEAMLDKCAAPGNNGPVYRDTRTKLMALNQSNFLNIQAEDTADGDMLVYTLSPSMHYPNSYETYVNPYTPQIPLRPLCLNSTFSCTPSPFTAPARGFYTDSMNGNQIFTPVNQGDISVVHYRVKEYRDIQGVRTLIGYTTYEYLALVKAGGRNLPQLNKNSSRLSYRAKANAQIQINFGTTMNDSNTSDSVLLWVDNSINGSVVQVKKDWRSSGTFTWTPGCKDIRKEPYFFVVNFYNEDDSFSRLYQSFAYNIYVDGDLNIGRDTVICKGGTYTLKANISGRYKWNNNAADSLSEYTAAGPGQYFLEVERNGCRVSDTIVLTEIAFKPSPYLGPDTTICNQPNSSPITLFTRYEPYVRYSWNVAPSYSLSTYTYNGAGMVVLTAENICGISRDTMLIRRSYAPDIMLPQPGTQCRPFSIELKPVGNTFGSGLQWSNGKTDTSVWISDPGQYFVRAENICGTSSDTIQVAAQDKPAVRLPGDTTVCFSQFPLLNAYFPQARYQWSNGDTLAQIKARDSGLLSVRVYNLCGESHDSLYIRNLQLPVAELGPDVRICSPSDTLLKVFSPYAAYLWNTGQRSNAIRVSESGVYSVRLSNVCGTYTDSVRVRKLNIPQVYLGRDTSLRKPFSLKLEAGTDADWYRWNTSAQDTLSYLVVTEHGTYRLRAGNACGSSTDSIRISDITNLEHMALQRVRIFPNPFTDRLQISSDTELESVCMYDFQGRLVHCLEAINTRQMEINTTDLPAGLYLLKLKGQSMEFNTMLLK